MATELGALLLGEDVGVRSPIGSAAAVPLVDPVSYKFLPRHDFNSQFVDVETKRISEQ